MSTRCAGCSSTNCCGSATRAVDGRAAAMPTRCAQSCTSLRRVAASSAPRAWVPRVRGICRHAPQSPEALARLPRRGSGHAGSARSREVSPALAAISAPSSPSISQDFSPRPPRWWPSTARRARRRLARSSPRAAASAARASRARPVARLRRVHRASAVAQHPARALFRIEPVARGRIDRRRRRHRCARSKPEPSASSRSRSKRRRVQASGVAGAQPRADLRHRASIQPGMRILARRQPQHQFVDVERRPASLRRQAAARHPAPRRTSVAPVRRAARASKRMCCSGCSAARRTCFFGPCTPRATRPRRPWCSVSTSTSRLVSRQGRACRTKAGSSTMRISAAL